MTCVSEQGAGPATTELSIFPVCRDIDCYLEIMGGRAGTVRKLDRSVVTRVSGQGRDEGTEPRTILSFLEHAGGVMHCHAKVLPAFLHRPWDLLQKEVSLALSAKGLLGMSVGGKALQSHCLQEISYATPPQMQLEYIRMAAEELTAYLRYLLQLKPDTPDAWQDLSRDSREAKMAWFGRPPPPEQNSCDDRGNG